MAADVEIMMLLNHLDIQLYILQQLYQSATWQPFTAYRIYSSQDLRPANEKFRYKITQFLIGWVKT